MRYDEATKQEARDELRRNTLPATLENIFRDSWTVRYEKDTRTIIIEHTGPQPRTKRWTLDVDLKEMSYGEIARLIGNEVLFSIDALNYELFPLLREEQIAKGEYNL
jgi:hypothetical protein